MLVRSDPPRPPRSAVAMSSRVGSRLVRGSVLAALSFAALTSPQLATERLGAQSAPAQPARPVFADGQAQIVPGVRRTRSSGSGRRSGSRPSSIPTATASATACSSDVTRPRQTETEGLKVPVIYESSPYFAGTSGDRAVPVGREAGGRRRRRRRARRSRRSRSSRRARTSRPRSSTTWVPRGFAVVHSDAPGTGLSQGCPTVGDATRSSSRRRR